MPSLIAHLPSTSLTSTLPLPSPFWLTTPCPALPALLYPSSAHPVLSRVVARLPPCQPLLLAHPVPCPGGAGQCCGSLDSRITLQLSQPGFSSGLGHIQLSLITRPHGQRLLALGRPAPDQTMGLLCITATTLGGSGTLARDPPSPPPGPHCPATPESLVLPARASRPSRGPRIRTRGTTHRRRVIFCSIPTVLYPNTGSVPLCSGSFSGPSPSPLSTRGTGAGELLAGYTGRALFAPHGFMGLPRPACFSERQRRTMVIIPTRALMCRKGAERRGDGGGEEGELASL